MKGFFIRLKEVWVIFGITLLLFVAVEIFFKIYFLFYTPEDARVNADCYAKEEWVKDYYSEFSASNTAAWEPYVYWKRKPFSGKYINIDDKGIRKTSFNPHPFSADKTETKIFFFGGSTMWGSGVRDKFTIPSLTGAALSKQGHFVMITNFGESGFVFSQELIRLLNELRRGNIPDIAIFYDGANDIYSSLQSGIAGIPQNEANRQKEFNSLQEKKKSLLVFFHSLNTLATVKFINLKFGKGKMIFKNRNKGELNILAQQTVNVYNENIRIINTLAKQYEFQAVFYWQPLLFDKPILSEYEKGEVEKVPGLKSFASKVDSRLFEDNIHFENTRFYNLSGIFKSTHEPLFIDWCHAGEYGNEIISQRISRDIIPVIDLISNYTKE